MSVICVEIISTQIVHLGALAHLPVSANHPRPAAPIRAMARHRKIVPQRPGTRGSGVHFTIDGRRSELGAGGGLRSCRPSVDPTGGQWGSTPPPPGVHSLPSVGPLPLHLGDVWTPTCGPSKSAQGRPALGRWVRSADGRIVTCVGPASPCHGGPQVASPTRARSTPVRAPAGGFRADASIQPSCRDF
jgi:hypothetical protein